MTVVAGKAGLEGADEAAARLCENARIMHERAAEARTRLQSIHVRVTSSYFQWQLQLEHY